jgi:hypothetical protein
MFARCANTTHDIVAHFLIRPRSVPRLGSHHQVPFPRSFFDVKWLATESVLLMSSYWLHSSPIQLACLYPAPQRSATGGVRCGTVALTTSTEHYVTHLPLFNI